MNRDSTRVQCSKFSVYSDLILDFQAFGARYNAGKEDRSQSALETRRNIDTAWTPRSQRACYSRLDLYWRLHSHCTHYDWAYWRVLFEDYLSGNMLNYKYNYKIYTKE